MKHNKCYVQCGRALFQSTVATVLGVLVLTSCSEDGNRASIPIDSDVSAAASSVVHTQSQLTELPVLAEPTSVGLRYPTDSGGDDRPGLIVEGFNDQDFQTLGSEFLVSTSTFRSNKNPLNSGDGYVHMVVYEELLPVIDHLDFYQPPLNSCLVRDTETDQVLNGEINNMSASGGSSLVFNTPSGPWFTFTRQTIGPSQHLYQVDNKLPGAFPEGISLSVPGDSFPNVPAYPLYEPEAPVRLLPVREEGITDASEFSWVAGPASGYIKINLLAYDSAENFMGFAVSCWVEDNGRFELPDEIVNYLKGSELTHYVRYSRVYARVDWLNGMVFHQSIEVAE